MDLGFASEGASGGWLCFEECIEFAEFCFGDGVVEVEGEQGVEAVSIHGSW